MPKQSEKLYTRRQAVGGMIASATALSFLDTNTFTADSNLAAIDTKDDLKITKLETFFYPTTVGVFKNFNQCWHYRLGRAYS